MTKRNIFMSCLAICCFVSSGYAQEQLSSIGYYPAQKRGPAPSLKSDHLLQLPFIDDFSSTKIYPNGQQWMDNQVYINNSFGKLTLGYGIATLDALDSTGAIYSHANISGFDADQLTSQPIDLDLGADTSVYLSFYYQPQGYGDAPEAQDSLILEFFAPQTNKWVWIWSTPGSPGHDFRQVMIPVRGAIFMQQGFQFRFKNRASLANAYEPSLKSNADHWHLDYVYLNNNRHYQDTIFNDLSLVRPTGSLLLNYEAIPWEHFQNIGLSEVKTIFPIHLQNLSGERKFFEPQFTIVDEYGSGNGFTKTLSADEIQAFQEINFEATFNYGFPSEATDSALFTVDLALRSSSQDMIPGNDALQYHQLFSNYYAFDDGSAEAGYGMVGEGSSNARVAYRFNNFQPGDSLVGYSIFFNRSFEDANRKYFQLAVWNEIDGQPGDLIHLQQGGRSSLEGGLEGFDYFKLDTARIVPAVFYIGWYQVTDDFLNVGFDFNTNNQDRIFYNMATEWKNSIFEGSLMLRPVFANHSKKSASVHPTLQRSEPRLFLYPNPVGDLLNLNFDAELEGASLSILDNAGRLVLSQTVLEPQLDLSSLKGGTYFVIVQKGSQYRISKKILVLND